MFTLANYREIALGKFGGLFTEADPRSLPPGASPQCFDVDFLIGDVGTRAGLSNPVSSFSPSLSNFPVGYIKSAQVLGPANLTLLEDAGTTLYQENLASPGAFTSIYSKIINSARAISTTVNQREYIGLSNLIGGSDQPRQYDGTNLDRISQVAPGAGPQVTVTSPTYPIVSIAEIYSSVSIDSVSWGSSINLHTAQPASANLYFLSAVSATNFTTGLSLNALVYVSGVGNLNGQNPNGTYAVTSIGSFTDADGTRQYFGVTANVANSDFARGGAGGTYQQTPALVQLSSPIPLQNAVVGGSITIEGASVPGWNRTFTIAQTPTEGQLSISSTALASNVATYDYTLQSGEAPGWQPNFTYVIAAQIVSPAGDVWQITTPGVSGGSIPSFASSPQADNTAVWTKQASTTKVLATVFNTNNGNGIFNIQNQPITSATQTSFTVAITGANFGAAAENGQAVTGSGTALIIDPGTLTVGTGNPGVDPIFGNATGGNVLVMNPLVAAGQRYAVLMFLTRNGFITPASPPVSFFTTGQTGQLTFSILPVGPADVIARIVAITLANAGIGGPYYWIPDDVIILGSAAFLGAANTFNKTVLDDNTSTSLGPITLSDTVLAASENISVEGNNLQQQRELAECVKVVQWAGRCFYLGERTKDDQFINTAFDGGAIGTFPAGWTLSPAGNFSVQVVPSPLVNTSIEISNTSSTSTTNLLQQVMGEDNTVGSTHTIITFGSTPTVGNTMVFFITSNGNLAVTPPAGLTAIADYSTGPGLAGNRIFVWTRTVQSGDGTTWTFPHAALTDTEMEWAGVEMTNVVPVTWMVGTQINVSSNSCKTPSIGPFSNTATVLVFTTLDDATSASFDAGTPSPQPPYNFVNKNAESSALYLAYNETISAGSITSTNSVGVSANAIYALGIFQPYGPTNPTGTTLANIACIYQVACRNAFQSPIIQPSTAYSVRVTASAPAGAVTGSLVIELYSPSLATNWPFTVNLASLTSSILEFTGPFSNPLWDTVPSDLLLRVYPANFPAGDEILIDRIEVFPTRQPFYTLQVAASYAQNEEAVDGATGAIETSLLTSESQTNHFTFLNKYYISTRSRTLAPIQSGTGEPSSWPAEEISNAVGCLGPLAADVGEEYMLVADDNGAYVFDGGNHIKITQEIQQIWDYIYKPSKSTVWILNDLKQQRILIGVPLPTPNQWLPSAPTNATPATPNVILMCSYLTLATGAQIAEGIAVHVSPFSGTLLFHDGRRKWTIWQIPAATGAWINRADGSEQIWFGQGGNGVSLLDATVATDNSAAIKSRYVTYAFADAQDREKLQLTQGRALYPYALIDMEGSGKWNLAVWPETLGTPSNPNPYSATQAAFTLANPALDDTNVPLNVTGNRAFLQIDSDGVAGTTWSCKRLDLAITDDPRIRVSGR